MKSHVIWYVTLRNQDFWNTFHTLSWFLTAKNPLTIYNVKKTWIGLFISKKMDRRDFCKRNGMRVSYKLEILLSSSVIITSLIRYSEDSIYQIQYGLNCWDTTFAAQCPANIAIPSNKMQFFFVIVIFWCHQDFPNDMRVLSIYLSQTPDPYWTCKPDSTILPSPVVRDISSTIIIPDANHSTWQIQSHFKIKSL